MATNKLASQKISKIKDSDFHTSKATSATLNPSTSSAHSNSFFIPSSSTKSTNSGKPREKAPFDKKKWRSQKYSMKSKIENWEGKKRKAILREYHKECDRKKNIKFDVKKIYDEESVGESKNDPGENVKQRKNDAFKTNHLHRSNQVKEEKKRRNDELKVKSEREEAISTYKKKKLEKYKKINKKTRKGQPVMKARLEYLLEKIQKSVQV